MTDERIQTTANKFAARGFFIWYVLILISIYYRLLILKQHPREWWDIYAIWCIGMFFVFIAYASKGVFAHGFKRRWLAIGIGGCLGAFIGIFALFFIMGRIPSVVFVPVFLVSFLLGMVPVIGTAYFLNRRWKRKEGIEDEK